MVFALVQIVGVEKNVMGEMGRDGQRYGRDGREKMIESYGD